MIEEGSSPKTAVKAIHTALSLRGRSALLPRIARAFARIVSRMESRDRVVLKVARESQSKKHLNETFRMLKDLKIKPSEVKIVADSSLIGGWRLEGREIMRDARYKNQLLDIYERVSGD